MNWFNIHFQVTLLIRSVFTKRQSVITNFTHITHKLHIWTAYFLHELTQHDFSIHLFYTNFTHKLHISCMNWCIMPFQVTLLTKSVVTNFTFEQLISFVNQCNMMIYVTHFWTIFEQFEWWNMAFQVTSSRKFVLTNFIFEWLVSFMIFQELCPDLEWFLTRLRHHKKFTLWVWRMATNGLLDIWFALFCKWGAVKYFDYWVKPKILQKVHLFYIRPLFSALLKS